MAASFKLYEADPRAFAGDALVLVVERGAQASLGLGPALDAALQQMREWGDFLAKPEQMPCLYPAMLDWRGDTPCQARRLLLIGLDSEAGAGDKNRLAEEWRSCGGTIAGRLREFKAREALVLLPSSSALRPVEMLPPLVEGMALGAYQFAGYKKKGDQDETPACTILLRAATAANPTQKAALKTAVTVAEAVCLARDLGHTPANLLPPVEFAATAQRLARKNLRIQVMDAEEMRRLGLNAILAVSSGSAQPPTLSVLEYRTAKKNPTLLLVGKALTFDSGGICLKPPANMEEMKYDMCGGAAVLAVMRAVAELGLAGVNVVGLTPATENLSGAAALKPGDVIRHYGGLHSEVVNTDAEGRLILADAMAYGVATYKPDAVIDLATLTGAAIVSLGHHQSGLLSNDDALSRELQDAAAAAGEPLWRLPLGPDYRKQLESRVADIKNAADRSGGTITAACYLQEFVGDTPWAHLDIAGTAWNFTEKSYIPKGPSGVGVRTVLRFLANWSRRKGR